MLWGGGWGGGGEEVGPFSDVSVKIIKNILFADVTALVIVHVVVDIIVAFFLAYPLY